MRKTVMAAVTALFSPVLPGAPRSPSASLCRRRPPMDPA